MIIKLRMKKNTNVKDLKFTDFRLGGENVAKLSRKVKIRSQRETLLISIPKAMAEMMNLQKGEMVNVNYENGKLTVEAVKENE